MIAERWRHPMVRQWLRLLIALLIATALAAALEVFWRADLAIYDAASPTGPAPSDVVIVAVDDASVAALGRWPWPRATHAALLDRLSAAGVRAIAFDVLFTEPAADAAADAALADALRRAPLTVLPLLVEMPGADRPLREVEPIPPLADAAAGIGHVHLELDRDGVARSVFLREGFGSPNRSHLALALLEHAPGGVTPGMLGERHPSLDDAPAVWVRDYHILIPYLGPPGHFTAYSYLDVLRGPIDAAQLRDKLVLIGVTAQGLGDAYPTPRSGYGVAMSGVEITANVLQAVRSGRVIHELPKAATVALALLPVLLVAACFLRSSPRRSLLLAALVWLGTLASSVLLLRLFDWWWPPAATLATLLVFYPLWSWRRLEATQLYLEEEFTRLAAEPFPLLGQPARVAADSKFVDVVQRRIDVVQQAAQRARAARRLFADTINGLPDATLLANNAGRIVLANPAAAALFGVIEHATLEGVSVDEQLFARTDLADLKFATLANAPSTVEATLRDSDRNLLVRTVPYFDTAGRRVGTIVSIADITELRAAQREREDVLRFLSHDMKSPASSLLGLAQLQRDPARALPAIELSQRLDLLAQRMLALVDGFVALARAESADPGRFEDFDLRDAVQDACDEVWAAAEARAVAIASSLPELPLLVRGDRTLIARAIVNLLGNAVKFSPTRARVDIHCEARGSEAIVRVADQGPGIAAESHSALFQRFSRRKHRGSADPGGAGLGLAFVRVVAHKHRGRAWADSPGASGSVFNFALPTAAPHGES